MRPPSELTRQYKNDIPPYLQILGFEIPSDWVSKYGYPENEKKADYYVKYRSSSGPIFALIEASKRDLKHKIKQLKDTAEIFKERNLQVDNYIIVLDKLNSKSARMFNAKKPLPDKNFFYIRKSQGNALCGEEKIYNKPIMLTYRDKFPRMRGNE